MKKPILVLALALAVTAFPAFGTTIQFSASFAGAARQVMQNDDATPDPVGSLVLAGIFTSAGSFIYNPAISVQANVTVMVGLGFQPFGFAPSSYNSSTGTWTTDAGTSAYTLQVTSNASLSQITGAITENTQSGGNPGGDASAFDGANIYLVIFNGTTVAASSQMGLFDASTTWKFPTNGNGSNDTSSLYSTGTGTTVNADAGSVRSSPNQLVLAASPEPSAIVSLLGGGGLLALLRRRRLA